MHPRCSACVQTQHLSVGFAAALAPAGEALPSGLDGVGSLSTCQTPAEPASMTGNAGLYAAPVGSGLGAPEVICIQVRALPQKPWVSSGRAR